MNTTLLLDRLDGIARSLDREPAARALIGLGSIGVERDRLDEHSDLDFFVIVADGHKKAFLDDITWLTRVAPTAYFFLNTRDGYKLLYADGVFCEFAVFEQTELQGIPFAPGAIVWKRPDVDDAIASPPSALPSRDVDVEFQVGEALTNLLVGLKRYARGERLSGMRFVQSYAVDRVLTLAPLVESPTTATVDPYAVERRIEARQPRTAAELSRFVPGYDRTPEAALALLQWLETHLPEQVNAALAQAIREHAARASALDATSLV